MIIGIDPGVGGALAVLEADGTATVFDLPNWEKENGRREVDAVALDDLIRRLLQTRENPAADPVTVFVEQVYAAPQATHTGMVLGEVRGMIHTVLRLRGLEPVLVQPNVWMKMALGTVPTETNARRREIIRMARLTFPDLESRLCRAMDHDRASALLIAAHGRARLSTTVL